MDELNCQITQFLRIKNPEQLKQFIPFDTLIKHILQDKNPVPGESAQWLMAPKLRMKQAQALQHDKPPKISAVLLPLYPYQNESYFTLIQRNIYDGVHSGQISLPGGSRESIDDNLQQTALREAKEEIGIDVTKVKLLRALSTLYIPPSNFIVQPFVACVQERPAFIPDPHEVVDILEISLSDMLDDALIKEGPVKISMGATIMAPYFDLHDKMVWGATAMILSEFREWIKTLIG